jgi:ribonuclease D
VDVIGIDVEMKPAIIPYEKTPHAALLQISCRKFTFLFDLYNFIANKKEWESFFRDLFLSQKIVKLGYHFSSDLNMLNIGFSEITDCFSKVEHVFDFQKIEGHLSFLPDPSEVRYPLGLSRLSEYMLGKPLCKSERMSNWAQRPLRKSQLRYAALDSHVLISIWDVLISKIDQVELRNFITCFSNSDLHDMKEVNEKDYANNKTVVDLNNFTVD